MQHFELKLTLYLKVDIEFNRINDRLSANINRVFLYDKYLKGLHVNKTYKPYIVGNLYPFDMQNRIYKSGSVYVLSIRSIDEDFLINLKNALQKSSNLDFNILSTQLRQVKYHLMNKVYTLNPAIATIQMDNGKTTYWCKENGSLEFIKKRIKDNLEKKYRYFFNEAIEAPCDFIQAITLKSFYPIVFYYKNTSLLAHNFELLISEDEISQKFIKLAFSVGILEKNSLGFGFLMRGKNDL